jgi:hypothetical protein
MKRYSAFTLIFFILINTGNVFAQRNLSDYDSTVFIRDTVRPFLKRLENLRFSGYIQPQFQVAGQKGAPSFEGGNFAEQSASRFLLRRARIRVDYLVPAKDKVHPVAMFAFQFDITERGAFARDVFLKLFDPKGQRLSMTMGLFARPFGYEVNLSSAFRESPERGRMSQTLMPAERDLGAMVSYESRKESIEKPLLKFDAGFFNGEGLSGTTDFDSYKDLISRFVLKPYHLNSHLTLGAGLSLLYGGWAQGTKFVYQAEKLNGLPVFQVDSSSSNLGAKAPRHYYGADVQLAWAHGWGRTEVRGEYWKGTQPGTASTTINPGTLPLTPTYIRKFDGAFFYFIQSIVNPSWELVARYDWYDPNTEAEKMEIGSTNLTAADIRYSTVGIGLTHYFSENLKVVAYHNFVRNESTSLPAFSQDVKDDIFTLRFQLRF